MNTNFVRYAIVAVVAIAVVVIWLAVANRNAPEDEGADLRRTKMSANNMYEVSIKPETEQVQQGVLHSWFAEVKTPDGKPVSDAVVIVDGGMPEHGHGLPTVPKTENLGDGRYQIHGVRFNMGGLWELRLSIMGPAERDEVIFNIKL